MVHVKLTGTSVTQLHFEAHDINSIEITSCHRITKGGRLFKRSAFTERPNDQKKCDMPIHACLVTTSASKIEQSKEENGSDSVSGKSLKPLFLYYYHLKKKKLVSLRHLL